MEKKSILIKKSAAYFKSTHWALGVFHRHLMKFPVPLCMKRCPDTKWRPETKWLPKITSINMALIRAQLKHSDIQTPQELQLKIYSLFLCGSKKNCRERGRMYWFAHTSKSYTVKLGVVSSTGDLTSFKKYDSELSHFKLVLLSPSPLRVLWPLPRQIKVTTSEGRAARKLSHSLSWSTDGLFKLSEYNQCANPLAPFKLCLPHLQNTTFSFLLWHHN